MKLPFLICCLLALLDSCLATRLCPRCVPLENLVVPTLGIQLSMHELSLAIAFHNRTVLPVATITGSPEYQTLMLRLQTESAGGTLDGPWETCHPHHASNDKPNVYQKLLISSLYWTLPSWLIDKLRLLGHHPHPHPLPKDPESPDTIILHSDIKLLLAQSAPSIRASSPRISLAIPPFLTDAQACKFLKAIYLTGKSVLSLEYSPSAAFTAYGFQLCRIDSDWAPCPPSPRRIMTLEYSEKALTASFMTTPLLWWMKNKIIYETLETADLQLTAASNTSLVTWLNNVTSHHHPSSVILLGPINSPSPFAHLFKIAVAESDIAILLVDANLDPHYDGHIDPMQTVVLGTAKIAKTMLESQGEDCIEDEECEEIRRRVDEIAGSPVNVKAVAGQSARTEL